MNISSAKIKLITSMMIFGTVGICVRYIDMPSGIIACARGLIGAAFLVIYILVRRIHIDKASIKNNLWLLLLSGLFIGINWILLFEAYRYTTVATATLCYYLAPAIVIVASPFVLKEKIGVKKAVCVVIALLGMICVSGVPEYGLPGASDTRGILCGIGAACFYASVILTNKHLKGISSYDETMVQLSVAAVVLVPYIIATGQIKEVHISMQSVIFLVVVGVIHTGLTYALYFGSMQDLPSQTVALFSYIDPVVAIILSAVILHENIGITGIVGAVMVLGSTCASELKLANIKHSQK